MPNKLVTSLALQDLLFFNKYEEFANPIVKAYMKYFATRNADSRETETINKQVSFYKTDTFIRKRYMIYEYDFHERENEIRKEDAAKALEEKKAMAKGFRDDGFPLEAISKRTGFTIDEIKSF